MIRITAIVFLLALAYNCSFGQRNDDIFSRLQAISNNGIDFYNIDGIDITSQKINASLTPKNIAKKFRQYKIKEKELINSDSLLGLKSYYVFKPYEDPKGFYNNISYYFVESFDQKMIGFTFTSVNKTDKEFERNFINLVKDDLIPKSIYNNLVIDSIDFAGRKISLDSVCHWRGVNNVQCPYYGQMNWSVHKEIDDAIATVNNQFASIKARENGKIIANTTVDVIFEGTETTAKKIIYDFTGITSALAGMSGGKTLTVYFVAAPVRKHNVSCVMSFWNNDQISPSGLAPLLEEVMKLK